MVIVIIVTIYYSYHDFNIFITIISIICYYMYIHRNNIHMSTYIYINQHDSIVMLELDQRKVALNI
jgi:hypothetical protein